ncbi:hypothetical protein Ct9H90mP29_23040 [bacterium]|nr:MAG: hypothetical protein Ct9H90mP29_23040 [bacterium]
MDLRKVKKLIELLEESGLSEMKSQKVRIRSGSQKVEKVSQVKAIETTKEESIVCNRTCDVNAKQKIIIFHEIRLQ